MIKHLIVISACFLTLGCSVVQYLPSSSCESVEYVRVGNQVEVKASCRV
jgi:hypothetical protein